MPNLLPCEFSLIRYVPDIVTGEFTNIGVILREADSQTTTVKFTRDWHRVRSLDPDADVAMLESLESELALRFAEGVALKVNAKPILETLEDSLSNSVQLTAMRGTLATDLTTEMEQLLRLYVQPPKPSTAKKTPTGRAAIVTSMRDAFEHAGVWPLMNKRIPASRYTQPGDPLMLDCGYRNGLVKIFHAVSLAADAESAKGLAYSAEALRRGVLRNDGVELQLSAVIESATSISDPEQYNFGIAIMQREMIHILTIADLAAAVDIARLDLRL
jgi:hypothetical protein